MSDPWYRFTGAPRATCGRCRCQVAPAERSDGAAVDIRLEPCGDVWMGVGEHDARSCEAIEVAT